MFDVLFGLNAQKLESSSTANPRQWFIDWVGGGAATASGEKITEETALTCAAVKAAVSLLAETIARLPWGVYEQVGDGKKRVVRDEHWAYRLLNREANPETSAYNWRETLQGHLGTWGNAYSEIEWNYNRTKALGLWQRSPKPARTQPKRYDDGALYYECHDQHGNSEEDIAPRDMIHVPGFGFDGLVGYSPISQGKETIGLAKGAERYVGELFGRDCRPAGVITVPGELSESKYKLRKQEFNNPDERHRIQLLEGGAMFAETQMKPDDVQMIDARRLSVEDIARIYRIPLPLLQLYMSGMAYASVVELDRAFIVYTMMPWFRRWQAEINRKLLKPPYFAEFNYQAFMQADPKTQNESYRTAFSFGGLTINDYLRKQNENPIGREGDRRFVPLNMIPLDRVDDYVDAIIEGKRSKGAPGLSDERFKDASRKWYAETLQRMLVREAKAAKQAAKKPERFVQWLDEYYEKARGMLKEAMQPAVNAVLAAGGTVCTCDNIDGLQALVNYHIATSKDVLLAAAECQPEQLAERVTAEVDKWPTERKHEGLEDPHNAREICARGHHGRPATD